jgi:predicted MPP superfamily phosphohydrolase
MGRVVTRRRFLKAILGGVAAADLSATGGAGYAALIEPQWQALDEMEVTVRGFAARYDGFTLAHVSDLHRGPHVSSDAVDRAVRLALSRAVDVNVLTGDYVSGSAEYAPSCARSLAPLAARRPTLACLGNHDHWTDADRVSRALADAGITPLRSAVLEVSDGLWIAAVDDLWEGRADLEGALEGIPDGAVVMLLAHEPDFADQAAADGRAALQLSDHSHGGQVWLPIIGPLILPYLARKYPRGLYSVGGMSLYVNRGVGLIEPAVRFNCRPEVAILTLRTA